MASGSADHICLAAYQTTLGPLVGIAGEDDLDAPDLCAGPNALASTVPERALQWGDANSTDQPQRPRNGRGRRGTKSEPLTAKNGLTAADAKLVEDAFERKLSQLAAPPSKHGSSAPEIAGSPESVAPEKTVAGQAKGIDKSTLTLAAPRRYRSREHLRYVMQQSCLICGRKPSDPHHPRIYSALTRFKFARKLWKETRQDRP